MFTPILLLPLYNTEELNKYRNRWKTSDGEELSKKILAKIRDGAGEDFLLWDFERGELMFLENACDLKGIDIFDEDITFPDADNFEAIDFSHAQFYHSKFRNACFFETSFDFTKFYNCEFIKCFFIQTGFYGATLEKIKFVNCVFDEYGSMTNCDFKESSFEKCFYSRRLFFDCRFDGLTTIDDPSKKPSRLLSGLEYDESKLGEIYKGIKDSYSAGEVFSKYRQYFFKQKQCITRYNVKNLKQKIGLYFVELIAGYGVMPMRVLCSMLILFLICSIFFIKKLGFNDGLILSAGAFFSFGANSDYLRMLPMSLKVLYLIEAFAGASLIAVFIVVLANLWFGEK